LNRGNEGYHYIVEDLSEFVCCFDMMRLITFANRAFRNFVDMKSGELVGESFQSFFAEESRDALECQVASLTRGNPSTLIEHPFKKPDGETRRLQLSLRAIHDLQGRFMEYHCLSSDVTALRRFMERQEDSNKDPGRLLHEK